MGSQLVREGSAEFLLSELFQEAPCSPKSAGVLLPGIQQEPQHLLHVCTICQLHSDRQEGTPKSHHNCLKIVKIPLPSLVKLYSSHCLKKKSYSVLMDQLLLWKGSRRQYSAFKCVLGEKLYLTAIVAQNNATNLQ